VQLFRQIEYDPASNVAFANIDKDQRDDLARARAFSLPPPPLDFSTPRRRQGCDEQGILFKRMRDLESRDHVESLSRASACVGYNGITGRRRTETSQIQWHHRTSERRNEKDGVSNRAFRMVSVSRRGRRGDAACDRSREGAIERRDPAPKICRLGWRASASIDKPPTGQQITSHPLIDPAFVKYSTAAAIKRKLPSALSTLRDTQLGSTLHSAKQKLRRVLPSVDYLPECALFSSSFCLLASAKAANSLQEAIFHEAFTGSQRTITRAGSACKTGPSFF